MIIIPRKPPSHKDPNRPRPLLTLFRIGLIVALIYAIGEAVGWPLVGGFFYAMFGPYAELVDKHQIDIWAVLSHPITLILGVIFVFGAIQGRR